MNALVRELASMVSETFPKEGEGIDEETRVRIFEPFVTTKQAQDGSGLGLAIVYGVVNAHTGFIDVTSEKGKGASFSIYLPVGSLAEESPEPEREEADRPVTSSETILVVEDEELLLDSLKSLIEAEAARTARRAGAA